VRVQDSGSPPQTATKNYTVLILEISTIGLPDGVQNEAYNASFSVIGQVGAVSWSEPTTSFSNTTGAGAAGTPCEGLTLNVSASTITGMPVNLGTCGPFTLRVTDSDSPPRSHERTLSIRIVRKLQITTTSLAAGITGSDYDQTVSATGGTPPFIWSEPGELFDATGRGTVGTSCEGLRLHFEATGATSITGIPINPGTCAFTVRVDDSGAPAQFDEQALSITITAGPLVITTTSLPPGAVNRTYRFTAAAKGGTPPFTWSEPTTSFDAGGVGGPATPCEGLRIDFATGTISGLPTVNGTCGPFTLQVDDSSAPPQTDSQTGLSIFVASEPSGRNDSIATATPLTNGIFLASISPYADPVSTANPDTDFYRLTASVSAVVTIEITAREKPVLGKLDPVVEVLRANGTRLTTCREGGDGSTTSAISGVDGSTDFTPTAFDDLCLNDDIELGFNRDSKLEFLVPSGTTTFYVHVLDWRGDARPDFLYLMNIIGAN
jgi:hypothetical protein